MVFVWPFVFSSLYHGTKYRISNVYEELVHRVQRETGIRETGRRGREGRAKRGKKTYTSSLTRMRIERHALPCHKSRKEEPVKKARV